MNLQNLQTTIPKPIFWTQGAFSSLENVNDVMARSNSIFYLTMQTQQTAQIKDKRSVSTFKLATFQQYQVQALNWACTMFYTQMAWQMAGDTIVL